MCIGAGRVKRYILSSIGENMRASHAQLSHDGAGVCFQRIVACRVVIHSRLFLDCSDFNPADSAAGVSLGAL